MTTENRDFKGVWIPKEVWLDDRLSAVEKIILVEIDSLDSTERGCWASNQHIAKFCQVSERTVSSAISKLKDLGYIYVQSFDGRQRELKSRFTSKQGRQANFASEGSKICEADMQDLRQSNTSNNTNKNKSYKSQWKDFKNNDDKKERDEFNKKEKEEREQREKDFKNKTGEYADKKEDAKQESLQESFFEIQNKNRNVSRKVSNILSKLY